MPLLKIILFWGLYGILNHGFLYADEETLKFIRELDKRLYRPSDQGLKDLSITLTNSLLKNHPTFSVLSAQLYFKSGKSPKLKIQGLDKLPEDIKNVPSQVAHLEIQTLQFFQNYTKELLGTRLEDKITEYEQITLKRDIDYDRVLLVPKMDSSLKKYFTAQTLVCQNFRILSIETTNLNGTQSHSKFTYQEVNGQILLDKVDSRISSEQATYKYEYAPINGIVLLQKISGKATNGTAFEIEFKNAKVNEGLEESLFED